MVVRTMVSTYPSPLQSAVPDDGRLVHRAQAGDSAALEELAHTCQRTAYLLGLQLLRDVEEARDVSQEATLRVLQSLARLDPRRPPRPWILRIVRNLVWDRLRRRRTRGREELPDDLLAPPDISDPFLRAERHERQRIVWRALSELTPEAREILVLRDYRDCTYAEIAEALSLPLGTVMSRLHRARARLGERVREAIGAPKRGER